MDVRRTTPDSFHDLFAHFVYRSAYTPGQLATLSSVPKTTIVNWLKGRVKRPRRWQRVVALAAALRLHEAEANLLLAAANQPPLQTLRHSATSDEHQALFSFWQTAVSSLPNQPVPFQAIPLTPNFVGRQSELTRLRRWLCEAHHPHLYLLHGMAGVGKTSVAAQLAYALRAQFPDGVLWARLDSSDTLSILATFAQAFGQEVNQFHDVASRSRVVRNLLQSKQALIVLDNAQTSEQIEPLLPPTGRCAVLVTTRRQDLAILVGAKRVEIRPFSPTTLASLRLFSNILGEDIVQANAAAFTTIAEQLGHLPLALTIVGSRLAVEPSWEIDAFRLRLQQAKQRLADLQFDTQSVSASFQLSYSLLTHEEQRLFIAAGQLSRHHFSAAAVAAVGTVNPTAVAPMLRRLHSLSLLHGGPNGRYQLHPLLHDFACDIETPTVFKENLVTFWHQFMQGQVADRAAIRQELPHIEVALKTAVETKQLDKLWQILDWLTPHLITWGKYDQAKQHLTNAHALLSAADEEGGQSWLALRLGQLARQQQRLDEAKEWLQTGLQLAQKQATDQQIAQFLTELGIVHNCASDYEVGLNHLTAALELVRQAPPNASLLSLLEELGVLATILGNRAEATAYYDEGYQQALTLGDEVAQVLFLKSLGALHHLDQASDEAQRLFTQGYLLAEKIGFRKGLMLHANNLGVVAFYQGQMAEAEMRLLAALSEAEQLHDLQAQKLLLSNLAGWADKNGRFIQATFYLERLLLQAEEQGWDRIKAAIAEKLEMRQHNDTADSQIRLRVFI